MKDYLKDLIDHTLGLGTIELIKVTGTDTVTAINAVAENKSVIISGTFKDPISDFIGVFGMPNLNKLKTIIGFDEYDETSKINVVRTQRDGVDVPSTIHFETKTGDFINDYRLMLKSVVDEKVKRVYHSRVLSGTLNLNLLLLVFNVLRSKHKQIAKKNILCSKLMVVI